MRARIFGIVLVISLVTTVAPPAQPAEAVIWEPAWHCAWNVQWYPVEGGELHGRGCMITAIDVLQWNVWADSYVPESYSLYTYVRGSDTCGSDFVTRMEAYRIQYGVTYGSSGDFGASGVYRDCHEYELGHKYRVESGHFRQWQSPESGWEGTYAEHIFGQ